jgi:hypothetical protein
LWSLWLLKLFEIIVHIIIIISCLRIANLWISCLESLVSTTFPFRLLCILLKNFRLENIVDLMMMLRWMSSDRSTLLLRLWWTSTFDHWLRMSLRTNYLLIPAFFLMSICDWCLDLRPLSEVLCHHLINLMLSINRSTIWSSLFLSFNFIYLSWSLDFWRHHFLYLNLLVIFPKDNN